MPAEPPRPARATHQGRGGSLSPARIRRPPRRRAGSMNTASTAGKPMSRTSAQTARTLPAAPYTPALARAMRRWSGSMLTASTGWSWARAIRSPPIPQHRSATRPGVGITAGTVAGHHLRARLLQPGAGEEHLPGPAELRPRLDPQLMLGERGGHELRRVLGPQRGARPAARWRASPRRCPGAPAAHAPAGSAAPRSAPGSRPRRAPRFPWAQVGRRRRRGSQPLTRHFEPGRPGSSKTISSPRADSSRPSVKPTRSP